MNRLPNISAGVWAFLAIVGLAAASIIAVRADEERKVTQSGGAPVPVGTPPPTPAPAATAIPLPHYFHAREPDNSDREILNLTENHVAEVKSLLSSDPSLNSLLAGESYTIQSMGPWASSGKESEFIGASVYITLDRPVSYDGSLPIVESHAKPEDGSDELYVDSGLSYELQAEEIESLAILVDLNKNKVVEIEVLKAASENAERVYTEYIDNLIRYIYGD